MKKIVALVVLIAGAFFGYKLLSKEECAGGKTFETVAACTAGGLSAEICTAAFTSAEAKTNAMKPVESAEQCQLMYPHCHKVAEGAFLPKAEKVCVVAGKPGEPIYGRIGANIAGGH
jgi:uncharacterized protein YgiB involved in biofilm formation